MAVVDVYWDEFTTMISFTDRLDSGSGFGGGSGSGSGDQGQDSIVRDAPFQAGTCPCATSVIDVREDVQAWVDGDQNYGWIFLARNQDDVRIASSEAAEQERRPRLEVEFTVP